MSNVLTVSVLDILYQIRISCQIPTLAEAIATRKIIIDTALKNGIKVEPEELQQAADQIRLANQLTKAEDTWAWLNKYHLTLDDFEDMAHTNILSNKLAIYLFEENVEKFFYQHQLDYTGAVTYEVIVDDEDVALELFYAVQEGEISFQEIVRQYVKEPEVRRAGGYQGIRRRTDFRPEIAAAVFATTPPQILKPIVTQKGVHLIWVEEIIQPELDEQLRVTILGDLFAAWLKQEIEKLEIVIQLEEKNCDAKDDLVKSMKAS
ncbi:peptidylprolyl isomerase [Scytonema hofmannii PCC 7110]|uniref:peptidylprolyl isomerase n=1 Tax=Scytonema hofmannii PCC 7110 TaxID=128403 RepID=A0A139WZ43_9CYAN|nr:peptidylprolyl isomerase [Scytonema hofmannii]KYC37653.1 peptidylprolyl isomerase [Scytonema hofmannii PCC 7110]